jgi:hypothetical protein
MHRPANAPHEEQRRLERLEDVASAVAALRRAIAQGDRLSIETFCWALARRLARAPLDGDDVDEICATIHLIEAQVKFGLHERLRKFLLPLATAIERQLEEAEKDLLL